jgi:nitrite reductase/ring-hydroxylating ferredoxin subunit
MNRREADRLTRPPDGRPVAEQPRWRRDFPIDWPQDAYISRRDFLKVMLLTSLGFTTGHFWMLIQNYFRQRHGAPPIREVARLDDIPVHASLVFDYPEANKPCVLVRLDERNLVAYGQQCTHLGCPLVAQPEASHLHCPCHEGIFDLTSGRPIAGPPRRPLPRVTLEVRDGVIYATGMEEGGT